MLRRIIAVFCMVTGLLCAQNTPLTFRPDAAEFSASLDRIIMISASPNQLHIYDPATNTDKTAALSQVPLSLSVSPDGLHAAVGHNQLISYVNLSTATVEKTFTTTQTAPVIVLGANYFYLLNTGASV